MSVCCGMKDILEERRRVGDAKWAARPWNPVAACAQPRHVSAQTIKERVMSSSRLRHIIYQLSEEDGTSKDVLYRQVTKMLEEMGYNRELPVLRWLGLFTSKFLKRLYSAVYVNESTLLKVKSTMGTNPVLFVPTHRSYGDFILMSYVCFHYEFDIPRIAAGMDFHGMTVMGEILRDSCAFFMRRTFAQDKLYSATFSEYVHALVTHGDGAIEFFIEGTRSRSAKSLMPKFGFLSMALRPYLTGLVPDISIVPVSICYDRCLEESLFAYELLGVPKPKESTKGLFKALSILKEDYGNVYITFGEPMSVADALKNSVDRSVHSFGPVVLQDLTSTESREIVRLAHDIIAKQRQLTVLTCFNIIAAILNLKLVESNEMMTLPELIHEVRWLAGLLRSLGVSVDIDDHCLDGFVMDSIRLHKAVICVCDGRIRLQRSHNKYIPGQSPKSLRGCELKPATMDIAVPLMIIQHYVNPCCQYLAQISFVVFSLASSPELRLHRALLREKLCFLYRLFSQEFVFYSENVNQDIETSLLNALATNATHLESDVFILGRDVKVVKLFLSILVPFLPAYLVLVQLLLSTKEPSVIENDLLKDVQGTIQNHIFGGHLYHPANLSLETCNNAIKSLSAMGILHKSKNNGCSVLSFDASDLKDVSANLGALASVLPSNQFLASLLNSKL